MATPLDFARDWVFNVTKPFFSQLKNRIGNIKIENKADGSIQFTSAEGLKNTVGRSKAEVEDIATEAVQAGNMTLNPNPYFTRGDLDYKTYIDSYGDCSIIHDNVPNAAGALKCDNVVHTLVGDTYCPMPMDYDYRATVEVKGSKDGAAEDGAYVRFYMGTINYDSDLEAIYPQNIGYVTVDGTQEPDKEALQMELTRDLTGINVYFTFKTGDISKIAHVDRSHFRVCKFHKKQPNGEYCYVGRNGRIYDNLGMSKDMKYTAWAVLDDTKADDDVSKYIVPTGETVDGKDEYTLQLTSALTPKNPNISYTVGDVWLQSFGGGTYCYWLSSQDFPLDNKWHKYESAWFKPRNQDGMNEYGKYRNGTAFVKLLMLPNYYYRNNEHGDRYIVTDDKISCIYGNIELGKRN